MKRLLVVFAISALTVFGCSTQKVTESSTESLTRYDSLLVAPDSVVFEGLVPSDSVYRDLKPVFFPEYPEHISYKRPSGKLRYYGPVQGGRVDINLDLETLAISGSVIPDTVLITYVDTVTVTHSQTVVQELDFFQQILGYAKTIAVAILIIAGGAFLFRLFGK